MLDFVSRGGKQSRWLVFGGIHSVGRDTPGANCEQETVTGLLRYKRASLAGIDITATSRSSNAIRGYSLSSESDSVIAWV